MQRLNRTLAGAALLAALAAPAGAQDLLIKASRVMVAPGSILEDSALLVRDGKIAYVGKDIPAEARAGARTVDLAGHTISPGFVLAATTLGSDADLAEGAFAFTPDLRVAEVFDAWSESLEQLAPHGVTSFGMTPSPRNVAGGIGVLAKPGKHHGRVAVKEAFERHYSGARARVRIAAWTWRRRRRRGSPRCRRCCRRLTYPGCTNARPAPRPARART